MSLLAELKAKAPTTVPDETCPLIDEIQAKLEQLRHDNARLRVLSLYWYQVAKRLAEESGR